LGVVSLFLANLGDSDFFSERKHKKPQFLQNWYIPDCPHLLCLGAFSGRFSLVLVIRPLSWNYNHNISSVKKYYETKESKT